MSVSKEVFEKYQKAGKIAANIREKVKEIVKEEMPILEVCEEIERRIREKGAEPAFPCNVSVNEIAAHYTSPPNDKQRIAKNSLVKVDIGVHVDGYIADTATTVCFNPEYENLVQAAEEALNMAVKTIQSGMFTSKLGSIIQKTIEAYGCKPISNLTGHQIGRFLIHAGKSLPNVSHISTSRIKAGEVYAIEPFVTVAEAAGRVESGRGGTIFRFVKHKSLKNSTAKQLLNYVENRFRTLPFTERWLQNVFPQKDYKNAFQELINSKAIMVYPPFIEASLKPVAQAEHTVLIEEKGCVVLT
ncbi:MAG: type II methionyl aminopeptidase [Candidatus Bathyarchaeia archaeon]